MPNFRIELLSGLENVPTLSECRFGRFVEIPCDDLKKGGKLSQICPDPSGFLIYIYSGGALIFVF